MYTSINTPQANPLQKRIGDAYLKLQLDSTTTAVLSMEYAQEVLVVPIGGITPIPRMPTCVWGLINRRNKLLWTIDLAQMLGRQPLEAKAQQHNVAILRTGNILVAVVVEAVKGVARFPKESIQSPIGTVDASLTPYLRGCILDQREILLVLDVDAIAHSPILQR